jgi:two-component system chemotaxis sensor kinase CheA
MNLESAVQTFVAESRELLESMEEALLRLEHTPEPPDLINAIFRAAHTIKGSAGVFGFDDIVAFTHHVETLLDLMRTGLVTINADLVALVLRCGDHMATMIRLITSGQELDAERRAIGDTLVAQVQSFLATAAQAVPLAPVTHGALPACTGESVDGELVAVTDAWHISLRFGREVLRNGMDPLALLRYLNTFGEIVHLTTLTEALPDAATMDPEACYLGLEISLKSDAEKATIEGAFEFIQDDCVIRVLPPRSKIAAYIQLIQELPEDTMRLGEILVASGALTPAELARGLRLQAEEATPSQTVGVPETPTRPLGEILVHAEAVDATVVTAALAKQQHVKDQKALESRLIRIDADKVDQLINLVGELVIAGAGVHLLARHVEHEALLEATTTLSRLVEEVRNTTLGLRMVQIGPIFQRFQRVVRDTSQELGKDMDLLISGAETELDKAVVEKIGDPLMHLVRNAMDHGIEPVDVRLAQGKTAKAHVRLHAYHDSGSIVIEVADDGGGLNRDKILRKAEERGLVNAATTLTDKEVYNLIFEPGFSTADQISNLSGRGVGMDVVRRNIEALRGTVELDTQSAQGTTVRIRLPLTLAIIDGFLIGVGEAHYVIPLDMVVECLELTPADRQATLTRGFINLRGTVLPCLWLRHLFTLEEATGRRENIVVVQSGGMKVGLVVDELLGEFQTVIKPLGKLFAHLSGISGSTILGSGEVAFILDVSALVQRGVQRRVNTDGLAQAQRLACTVA